MPLEDTTQTAKQQKHVTISIRQDHLEWVDQLCAERGISRSRFYRVLTVREFKRLDKIYFKRAGAKLAQLELEKHGH